MRRPRSRSLRSLSAALVAAVFASAALAADPSPMPTSATAAAPVSDVVHLPWTRHASIYEVNIRQVTPQGTFKAFEAQLPRLRRMGVDILWIMPAQPIGALHRKGTLGSYYAIRDYTAVNPEFGTLEDVRHLVKAAHAQGFHVILDWVANHTAWDHPWVKQHPDWYKKNAKGEIHAVTFNEGQPNEESWSDVVGLDYGSHALWDAMIGSMTWWLKETDIDGFRCDVAGLVPTPFWNEARRRLDAVKPVFMLAEWDDPGLHAHAFDMTYDWGLLDAMKAVAAGQGDARTLRDVVMHPKKAFPADAYRMTFTSNHDVNSWQGSDAELYGPEKFALFATLAATLPGMPLVYGGQEAGLDKRVAFFEKDPMAWPAAGQPMRWEDLYTRLLTLKGRAPVLANGAQGAPVAFLDTGNDHVLAYRRGEAGKAVRVVANVSAAAQVVTVAGEHSPRTLKPWEVVLQSDF